MKRYISILRGINVSGQKKIIMADLKSLYENLGMKEVSTYIQSGNVIFNSDINAKAELKALLEKAIEKNYKFQVPILVFHADEFNNIVKNVPYKGIDLEKEGTKFLISFLASQPGQSCIENLNELVSLPEKLTVKDYAVYLHCPNGYGVSKLSNTFLEKKLNVKATTRSIKTVYKIQALLNANLE